MDCHEMDKERWFQINKSCMAGLDAAKLPVMICIEVFNN